MDLHRRAVEQRLQERDDGASPPAQVVVRAVDVEEPQHADAEAALVGEGERHVLVVHLRDRVGPPLRRRRADHELRVLGERRCGVAVDVRRRGDHEVDVEGERDARDRIHPRHVELEGRQRAAEAGNLLRGEVGDGVTRRERRLAAGAAPCSRRTSNRKPGSRRSGATLPRSPYERSSMPTTSYPSASRRRQRFVPTKPAAPVTPTTLHVCHAAFLRSDPSWSRIPGTTLSDTPRTAWPLTISG